MAKQVGECSGGMCACVAPGRPKRLLGSRIASRYAEAGQRATFQNRFRSAVMLACGLGKLPSVIRSRIRVSAFKLLQSLDFFR